MEFKRNLKRYMIGEDVMAVKLRLLDLGYLALVTHNVFGNDTHKAVKAFQAGSGLQVDGIVGQLTWAALMAAEPVEAPVLPWYIGDEKAVRIGADLAGVSETRRMICLKALEYAIDPDQPGGSMRCFYVRGGNLFDQDLTLHKMTEARLQKYFKNTAYKPYYDGGRQQLMQDMAAASGYKLPGCDCSGMIVGLWRYAKVKSTGFDANANSLYSSFCTRTDNLVPGDLCWKSGHIGLYVGGSCVVESIGGAYGVQLTDLKKRRAFNYQDRKLHTFDKWTGYGDPKVY